MNTPMVTCTNCEKEVLSVEQSPAIGTTLRDYCRCRLTPMEKETVEALDDIRGTLADISGTLEGISEKMNGLAKEY